MGHRCANLDGSITLNKYRNLPTFSNENYMHTLNPPMNEIQQNGHLFTELNDQVMALQMANLKLKLYLKASESEKKCVEADLALERNYIKKLEDNIANLKKSRVIMDPITYHQVADDYIASSKRPVRRTHTCHPWIGQSDLVCDQKVPERNTLDIGSLSNSCPTSPLRSKSKRYTDETKRNMHGYDVSSDVTRSNGNTQSTRIDPTKDYITEEENFDELLDRLKKLYPPSSPS